MNIRELRKMVQEEIQNMNLESKKYKVQPKSRIKETKKRQPRKLNEGVNLSKFDFDFDMDTTKNMDCDDFLPHSSYDAQNDDGQIAQAWLWVEKNGKCNFAVTDDGGEAYVEKVYPTLAAGLKVMKKAIRKTEIEMLVKGVKVTM